MLLSRHTRRREFITLLGGAAAWPLTARAQYPAIVPTVAFFVSGTPSSHGLWFAALVERLRELGWIENRTVAIEYRFAQGRQSFVDTMGELVRRKVDVIVTNGTDAALVAKQATSAIPIVLAAATDPVGTGLVASLPRPGGNITGLSLQAADLAGKRVALLREVVPGLHRLAVMVNVGSPAAVLERSEVQSAAAALGLDLVAAEIRRAEDIAPAFETLKGRADAAYICGDPLVTANRVRISTLALGAQLPTMQGVRDYVRAGGLISYGANFLVLYRRAAELVDKILRGARPADLPIEQPTTFDLVVNLKTAKTLGLEIPETVLARADEVIE
jgi:putative ABC transport system substrate-binding protein